MDLSQAMGFGYADPDKTRYCYLRVRTLQELIKSSKLLDALLDQLQVPGKSSMLQKLPDGEKLRAIEGQIDHFRSSKTSMWYEVPAPEVLAASIFFAFRVDKVPKRLVYEAFGAINNEAGLRPHVARWLNEKGFIPYVEVPLGTKRIDVLGYRKGGFLTNMQLIGIEMKNDLSQLKRGLDQMTTFREYCHSIYLACTPFLAADYLDKHASASNVKHWDAAVLRRKLEGFGFGLLLVEGRAVYEAMSPKMMEPDAKKIKAVLDTVATLGALST